MGLWTALTNQPPFNASQMLQLTDGTIMVQEEDGNDASRHWWRLTPDKFGNYINGSWSKLADMANSRRFYASAVLADGRVLVAGGEYSDAGGDTDKAEIYNPVTNTWTSIGNPGWGEIGDAAASMLADGRLLAGNLVDARTALYDPAANTWAAAGNMAARSNEECWTLLPPGSRTRDAFWGCRRARCCSLLGQTRSMPIRPRGAQTRHGNPSSPASPRMFN